jgi:hypothetical protein
MMRKLACSSKLHHPSRWTNQSQLETMMKSLCIAALVAASALLTAHAQSFDEGATTPSAEELKTLLAGQIFTVNRPDGNNWRLEFKANGYFFVNTNSGYADSGEWNLLAAQKRHTSL